MTESLDPASSSPSVALPAPAASDLAEELLGVIQAVDGVTAVYPAQPLWQSIAGAAVAVITGESMPLIAVTDHPHEPVVKARIGVGTLRPAPQVAREVAQAVRSHLLPRVAVVEVYIVKVGT
ncbi:hypothetical protein [Paenarthrobacter aurescens]|uniref:Asp23/Gls24 family envelope stress response protein n=1 Tax=Paenarthrobacter aurescens TaxID=43663 RepID=A0A4Y3NE98_PAEAU|nr:hypothetical protein [Paenarthrobacter aurescens]MDO6145399.1 hypothetical protein [Paenarthrobacter aurescens]MDO6149204.1 hypothetical protein [Paenarthrobacter aurescens]MDO6160448.1 hypothetical protein [Paenarthrobacter aurescens]MDO6164307.1 hypothetical protein [Paenarthrobacter aurescens]GEB19573.1 hypothetical protein AAU01_23280 [Paenarthrobacter aurescens]